MTVTEQLVEFSNYYGSNEELVLAGGGNTSAKEGDIMYIKGSGTSLSTITADGFVKMNRVKLGEIFSKTYPENDKEREALSLQDLFSARITGEEKRPSVETMLHSLFNYRFVLHLHPALVNGLTCSVNGKEKSAELFGDKVLWIEPCKPGYTLAKLCFDELNKYKEKNNRDCDIVLLANHGVFVADNTVGGLGEKLDFVLDTIGKEGVSYPDFSTGEFFPDKANEAFEAINTVFGEYGDYTVLFEPNAEAVKLSKSKESASAVMKPFNPDQIVYCKAFPVYAQSASEIPLLVKEYEKENGYLPKIIIVKDCGFYAADKTLKGSETAAMLFDDAIKIYIYSKSFGGPCYMTDELTDFIVNWEAESYRSKQQ